MADLYNGAARNFPSTQHTIYENKFRDMWWDASIMQFITNNDWKGRFRKIGTEIRVPVRPTVKIRDTVPGAGIIYQKPKGTDEMFTIGRESYWALEFMPEDMEFSALDFKSPLIKDAGDAMAEHIEKKFGYDIINKVPAINKGNSAGFRSHGYDLGATGTEASGRPKAVKLFQTQTQCDAASDSTYPHKAVGPDFLYTCFSALKEQKGGKGREYWMVLPTIVSNKIHTSEIKMCGWMDLANTMLRKDVDFLGSFNGANNHLIVDDTLLPTFSEDGKNIYPILFGSKIATTFADEVVIRDSNLKDIDSWDEYHRCKSIYDWFLRYPEFIGLAYVYL